MSSPILKWICPPPETFEEPSQDDGKVEWFRCLPYVLIHLACLSAFFFPVTLPCILIALLSYGVRMFAITAFYHRYFAHRSFKTSRLVQFLGAAVACSSGQRGPLYWPPTTADITDIPIRKRMFILQMPKFLLEPYPMVHDRLCRSYIQERDSRLVEIQGTQFPQPV